MFCTEGGAICSSYTCLFVEPYIGNRILVERPADHVAHEREQQEVHGRATIALHGFMLTGSAGWGK